VSDGQAAENPLHRSSTSHAPALGRQTVVAGATLFEGQSGSVPVQCSASSHGPAAAQHTTLDGSYRLTGQIRLVGLHLSSTSHGPALNRHVVVLAMAGKRGAQVPSATPVRAPTHA
jgi:hypothetical protein